MNGPRPNEIETLINWAEDLAQYHQRLASAPDRNSKSRRGNAFKAQRLRRIATLLRESSKQNRGNS